MTLGKRNASSYIKPTIVVRIGPIRAPRKSEILLYIFVNYVLDADFHLTIADVQNRSSGSKDKSFLQQKSVASQHT